MGKLTAGLLDAAILLATVVALLYLVRMGVGVISFGVNWHWGGALVSVAAPALLAAARLLLLRTTFAYTKVLQPDA